MLSELTADERQAVLKSLEARGWLWQGDWIYAPHRMLWLHKGLDFGSLEEFYEKFSARLAQMKEIKPPDDPSAPYYEVISDNESLVSVLHQLLEKLASGN